MAGSVRRDIVTLSYYLYGKGIHASDKCKKLKCQDVGKSSGFYFPFFTFLKSKATHIKVKNGGKRRGPSSSRKVTVILAASDTSVLSVSASPGAD